MKRLWGWILFMVMLGTLLGSRGVYAENIHQSVGNYSVPQGAVHHGNISLNVGNVTVRGTVDGNVHVNVGNVVVTGTVNGNVSVGTGNISTPDHGRITGSRSVGIGSSSTTVGNLPSAGMMATMQHLGSHAPGFWSKLWGRLLINVVISLILVTVFPRFLQRAATSIDREPLRTGFIGCVGIMAWVVAMVGLAVIIIGIPLAILLAFAGVLAALFANSGVVWVLGKRLQGALLPHQTGLFYASVVAGGVVLTALETVPGLGPLVELVVTCLGIGALIRLWVWKPVQ